MADAKFCRNCGAARPEGVDHGLEGLKRQLSSGLLRERQLSSAGLTVDRTLISSSVMDHSAELRVQYRRAEMTLDTAKSELEQEMLKTQQTLGRATDSERQVTHFIQVMQEAAAARDREGKDLAADLLSVQQGTVFAAEKADSESQRTWMLEQRLHTMKNDFALEMQRLQSEQSTEVHTWTSEVHEYRATLAVELERAQQLEHKRDILQGQFSSYSDSKSLEIRTLQEEVTTHQQGRIEAERSKSEVDMTLSALNQELLNLEALVQSERSKVQQVNTLLINIRQERIDIQTQHQSEEIRLNQFNGQRGGLDAQVEEQRLSYQSLQKAIQDQVAEFDRDQSAFHLQVSQQRESHQQTITITTHQHDEDKRTWHLEMSGKIEQYELQLQQKQEELRLIEIQHGEEHGTLAILEREHTQQIMELRSQFTIIQQNYIRFDSGSVSTKEQIRSIQGSIQGLTDSVTHKSSQTTTLRQDLATETATYVGLQQQASQEIISWEMNERELQSRFQLLQSDYQSAQTQVQQFEMQLQVSIRKIDLTQIRITEAERARSEYEGRAEHRYNEVQQLKVSLQNAIESRTEAMCQADAMLAKLKYAQEHAIRLSDEILKVRSEITQVTQMMSYAVESSREVRNEMFCLQCGNKFLDDSNFCRKCGAKRSEEIFVEQAPWLAGGARAATDISVRQLDYGSGGITQAATQRNTVVHTGIQAAPLDYGRGGGITQEARQLHTVVHTGIQGSATISSPYGYRRLSSTGATWHFSKEDLTGRYSCNSENGQVEWWVLYQTEGTGGIARNKDTKQEMKYIFQGVQVIMTGTPDKCESCGNVYAGGAVFCRKCGQKKLDTRKEGRVDQSQEPWKITWGDYTVWQLRKDVGLDTFNLFDSAHGNSISREQWDEAFETMSSLYSTKGTLNRRIFAVENQRTQLFDFVSGGSREVEMTKAQWMKGFDDLDVNKTGRLTRREVLMVYKIPNLGDVFRNGQQAAVHTPGLIAASMEAIHVDTASLEDAVQYLQEIDITKLMQFANIKADETRQFIQRLKLPDHLAQVVIENIRGYGGEVGGERDESYMA